MKPVIQKEMYYEKIQRITLNAVIWIIDEYRGSAPERSSEPDWNEVCHILCLAGEGGAACNCDLIP